MTYSAGVRIFTIFVLGLSISSKVNAHAGHEGHDGEANHGLLTGEVLGLSKISAALDMRPSSFASGSSYFLDNEVSLSYAIQEKTNIGYIQRFQVPLNGGAPDMEAGPDFHEHYDGFLRFSSHLGTLGDAKLSYEGRAYAPTSSAKRSRGFVTAISNFFKVEFPFTSFLSLCLTEGPALHIYSRSEYSTEEGDLFTNPWFENRVSFGPNLSLFSDRLKVSLPLLWHEYLHYSSRAEARFNGAGSRALWISPEIVWGFSDQMKVGVSYHSENLFSEYSSEMALDDGLRGGAFQLVYQLAL